jgi:hypothetical protein
MEEAVTRITEKTETVCMEPPTRGAELKSGASIGERGGPVTVLHSQSLIHHRIQHTKVQFVALQHRIL